MIVFKGNITGTVDSVASELPQKLESFSLVDKSGSANTVNVTIDGVAIIPNNKSITGNDIYKDDLGWYVEIGKIIRVVSSGSLDYYFNLVNVNP